MQPCLHGYYGKVRDYYSVGMWENQQGLVSFMGHMQCLSYPQFGHITQLSLHYYLPSLQKDMPETSHRRSILLSLHEEILLSTRSSFLLS